MFWPPLDVKVCKGYYQCTWFFLLLWKKPLWRRCVVYNISMYLIKCAHEAMGGWVLISESKRCSCSSFQMKYPNDIGHKDIHAGDYNSIFLEAPPRLLFLFKLPLFSWRDHPHQISSVNFRSAIIPDCSNFVLWIIYGILYHRHRNILQCIVSFLHDVVLAVSAVKWLPNISEMLETILYGVECCVCIYCVLLQSEVP